MRKRLAPASSEEVSRSTRSRRRMQWCVVAQLQSWHGFGLRHPRERTCRRLADHRGRRRRFRRRAAHVLLAQAGFRSSGLHAILATRASMISRTSIFGSTANWIYPRCPKPSGRLLMTVHRRRAASPSAKAPLYILTSGWNPGDSQFALSSKFVPFLFRSWERRARR